MTPLTVPKEVLARACATNFIGAVWCVDEEWMMGAYRALTMIGFEAAVKMENPRAKSEKPKAEHDHEASSPEEGPPYSMVGSVAVMGIDGPISKQVTSLSAFFGGTSTVQMRNAMRQAAVDPKVKSILVRVSSPGGTSDGVGDLADDIRAIRDIKPVVMYAEDVMASAAYWLGAQGTHVMASPHAEVGSIGVYMRVFDDTEANEKAGIKVHNIRSTPKKAAGLPPIREGDLKEIQKRVDSLHETFVEAIAMGRGSKLNAEKVATGEIWPAKAALGLGLVDSVGSLDAALALAQKLGGEADLGAAVRRKKEASTAAAASVGTPPLPQASYTVLTSEARADITASGSAPDITIEEAAEASAAAPKQSDTLLRGVDASSEQATRPEPQPEDPDMTKTDAGDGSAGSQGGATSGSPPVAPVTTPQTATTPAAADDPRIKQFEAFMAESREKEAKAAQANLKTARERAHAALPHMSAEQIATLVQTPEAADTLIEGFRGSRPSTDISLAAKRAEETKLGIPSVREQRKKDLAAMRAGADARHARATSGGDR